MWLECCDAATRSKEIRIQLIFQMIFPSSLNGEMKIIWKFVEIKNIFMDKNKFQCIENSFSHFGISETEYKNTE